MGAALVQCVEVRSILAANLDDIDETGCGQQGGTRAAAFQQGVCGDGGAVHEFDVSVGGAFRSFIAPGDAQVGQPGQDRLALVEGRGCLLVHAQVAVL